MRRELKNKQKRFVEEYMIDFNGSRAAIAAGYSKKTADVQAAKLLRRGRVAEAVRAEQEKLSKKSRTDAEWFIAKNKKLYARGIRLLRDGRMTDGRAAAKALELIGKHLGFLVDRVDHKHSGEMAQIVTYEFPDNGRKTSG